MIIRSIRDKYAACIYGQDGVKNLLFHLTCKQIWRRPLIGMSVNCYYVLLFFIFLLCCQKDRKHPDVCTVLAYFQTLSSD